MCVGGKFFKKILPIAALAAEAYFTGGGSLAGLFGSGAANAAGAGAAAAGGAFGSASGAGLSSAIGSGATSLFTGGASLGGAASSAAAFAAPSAFSVGSALTGALNFAKDNSFWLGQGANALGVGSQSIANNQRIRDVNRALERNDIRSKGLVAQANGINDASLQNLSLANQNMAVGDAFDKRNSATQQAYTSPQSIYLPQSDSAPKEVKEAGARRISDILDAGRNEITAGARLNSYGDVTQQNTLNLAESGRKIATLQDFQNGNSNLLGTTIQRSLTKPRAAQTFGDIAQGIGSIANAYASTRPKKKRGWSDFSLGTDIA